MQPSLSPVGGASHRVVATPAVTFHVASWSAPPAVNEETMIWLEFSYGYRSHYNF